MITFNVQAHNGNYYIGFEPGNGKGNCWGDEKDALVFTIEQARELVEAWQGYLKIVISVSAEPILDEQFKRELFCAKGGSWYGYKEKLKIELNARNFDKCEYCGACRIVRPSGEWQFNCECYDPSKRPKDE